MLQAGVLVGEPAGAAFYRGNARCLIFHWVEEVDSLLPAARMWGGESEGGPSASALASPWLPGPHLPTPHPAEQVCSPVPRVAPLGVRHRPHRDWLGCVETAQPPLPALSFPAGVSGSLLTSPWRQDDFLAYKSGVLRHSFRKVRKPLATALPPMFPVWVQMFKHLKFF